MFINNKYKDTYTNIEPNNVFLKSTIVIYVHYLNVSFVCVVLLSCPF